MSTTTSATVPRVYVGTYAKYNSGSIAGAWLDLEDYSDREAFMDAARDLHKDEADPELMFQDFEGFPKSFYGESDLPESLWEWLAMDEDERELLERYQDATGDKDATIKDARDAQMGTYGSGAEAAESMAEEMGMLPKDFPNWIVIDWEATWDCNLRHDFSTSEDADGRLWLFRH